MSLKHPEYASGISDAALIKEALEFCDEELASFDSMDFDSDSEVCCQRSNTFIRELVRRLESASPSPETSSLVVWTSQYQLDEAVNYGLGYIYAEDGRPEKADIPLTRLATGAGHSAAEIVTKIAQVANAVGFQANEPAMELAGQIVSVLAANPEHIDRFMTEGSELLLDGTLNHENGSLSYRAISGSILSPSVLREKKGQQQ